MKPEEIDKLFGERLKNAAPTPPADLWNRLQEKMEAELPQEKEVKRGGIFMWVNNYAAAAAVTLLLSVGGTLYMLQDEKPVKPEEIAQTEVKHSSPVNSPSEEADAVIVPAEVDRPTSIAAVPEVKEQVPQPTESFVPQAESPKVQAMAKSNTDKAALKPQAPKAHVTRAESQPEPLKALALHRAGNAEPAANTASVPLEIIIKRSSDPVPFASEAYTEDVEAAEEGSGFDKKRRLAKNIFKQVANLSNGERVELSELGINANKIAFETQIGKQKISKVIHL